MLRQLIIDFAIAVRKTGKWLVLVSIAISQSGCFKSDVALISEKQAIFPFEVITFQTDSTTGESATLVHEGGGYVVVAEPSFQLFSSFGNGSTFRLMPIEHGLYAVQEGIQAPYHYSVVEIDISGRSIREFGLNDLRRDGLKGLRSCDPKSPASTNASSDVCVDDIKSFVGYARDAIDAGEKPSTEYAILSILPARASLRDGLAALRRGDYGTALSALRPLAEKGDAEALSALGTMYYAGKGVPKSSAIALKWYRLAAEQRNAAAENNLGVMYEKGEGVPADTSEAERWYGLAAAQGHDQAKRNLKDIRTNVTASERLETSDDAAAYAKQAQDLFLAADLVSALANWNRAIRLKPDDAAAHLSRASVYEMQGDLPSALEDYKAAALLFPKGDPNYENAQSHVQAIQAELATTRSGHTSETLALSGNDRWVQIGSREDLTEAIDIARVYTAFELRVVRAQNGWFAVVLGPYAVSDIDNFRRSYSGPALPPDTYLVRGTGYVETVWLPSSDAVAESQPSPEIVTTSDGGGSLSSWPPADICRQALNPTSDDWDTMPQYADYVAEAQRRGLSVDDCRGAIAQSESNKVLCVAALTLDKSNWDARDGYARYVIEAKRRNLTISDCRGAIGLPPLAPPLQDLANAALCRRALNVRMDDWDRAAAFSAPVEEAKRRNLSIDDCRVAVGLPKLISPADWAACANTQDPDGSVNACTTIINAGTETNANLAVAHYDRGLAHNGKGDRAAAIADFDSAIQLAPDLADAYANRGLTYLGEGNYDSAIADCSKAIELKPDDTLAYSGRGLAYEAKGSHDQAIADYDRAIQIDPNYGYAYFGRGQAYDAIGEPAKAIVDLRIALRLIPEIDPVHSDVLASIATVEKKLVPAATPVAPGPSASNEAPIYTGTGIAVSRQGQVLTNNHVIEQCHDIRVRSADDMLKPAVLLHIDKTNDLALLKIDGSVADEEIASIRVAPPVRNGEDVAVYGFPLFGTLSSSGNIVRGNVSALTGLGDDVRYLQVTAPVQKGNSGGPLLDDSGAVIGVVVAKLNALGVASATGDLPQNVAFAIKASVAASFLEAHHVIYRSAPAGEKLDLPSIADAARKFTVLIVCQ